MSDESLIQKLKSFTPDRGQLDRHTLIFAAGVASVRLRWNWPIVILTIVQFATVVTLSAVLWLNHGEPAPVAVSPQPAPAPAEPSAPKPHSILPP